MNRRADQLRAGDRIVINDMEVTLQQVHPFAELNLAGTRYCLPACVLLIYGDVQSHSAEPGERFKLVTEGK